MQYDYEFIYHLKHANVIETKLYSRIEKKVLFSKMKLKHTSYKFCCENLKNKCKKEYKLFKATST